LLLKAKRRIQQKSAWNLKMAQLKHVNVHRWGIIRDKLVSNTYFMTLVTKSVRDTVCVWTKKYSVKPGGFTAHFCAKKGILAITYVGPMNKKKDL